MGVREIIIVDTERQQRWSRRWMRALRSRNKAVMPAAVNGRHPAALSKLLRQPQQSIMTFMKTTVSAASCRHRITQEAKLSQG